MSEHTQGPVYLVSVVEKDHERQARRVHNIFNRDGLYAHIAECGNADNARRLVAAWNACQGLPTEVLEAQQSGGLPWSVADQIEARVVQAELVGALGVFVGRNSSEETVTITVRTEHIRRARALIARATGAKV